ncbi:hypothetical protein CQW39_14585 [Streptomyces griseofuscus]|uniref:hypothetical protein n=1 Tax=Streptomyces griseofuscus TaxID=146922 RepID=UPI000F64703C|nr:hypothetical protein [Streptomyces griseofuscus]RRQ78272.1 hypothetical protein CQW39_14585 [Streptomyces griseofuscus]
MSSWLATVLIAVVTALAATLVSNLTFAPRLEARNRRIKAGHREREHFAESVLCVLVNSARLSSMSLPSVASENVQRALLDEQERWHRGVSTATEQLADRTAPLSFLPPLREVALRLALNTRLVWISERSEESKLATLLELAGAAQGLYFAAWWRRPQRLTRLRQLTGLMDDLEEHRR